MINESTYFDCVDEPLLILYPHIVDAAEDYASCYVEGNDEEKEVELKNSTRLLEESEFLAHCHDLAVEDEASSKIDEGIDEGCEVVVDV